MNDTTPAPEAATPFWKQPAIYVTAAFLPLIYAVVLIVLWPGSDFTTEIKVMVVSSVMGTVLGGVMGFWLGSSQSSARNAEQAAALTKRLIPPIVPTMTTTPVVKIDDSTPVSVTEVPKDEAPKEPQQ